MRAKAQISLLNRALWLSGSAILMFASYWSFRAAAADFFYRLNTISSLSRSVSLAEGDAEFHALLAEHQEGMGIDPDPQFSIASSLSPVDSRYWIRLGFSAESKGNYKGAEDYLLRAAAVDRKFDPAWALVNFYFRRGNTERFWFWADKAMAMTYGNATSLFRLFWDMSDDPALVRSHIPSDPERLAEYLSFLLENGHSDVAGPVARDVAERCDASKVPALQRYCRMAYSAEPHTSLDVWNALCRRKLLPVEPMNPAKGLILGDPGFRMLSWSQGFGWYLYSRDGLTQRASDLNPGLFVQLSGTQPEDCPIAEELLAPVDAHTRYRIRYSASAETGSSLAGLRWQVIALRDSRILAESELTIGPQSGDIEFQSAESIPLRLLLRYIRNPGALRAHGGVTISALRSELAQ